MLESASMTVSNTIASVTGTFSAFWGAMTTTIGLVPAIIVTGATAIGLYVSIKWLWKKAKQAWNNRGVKVIQTPVVNNQQPVTC